MDILSPGARLMDEAMDKLNFPVEVCPLLSVRENGEMIDVPAKVRSSIVRTDTGKVIGTHGSRWKLREYKESVGTLLNGLSELNMLDNRTDMKLAVLEDGAKMRMSLTFPQITIEPKVGDISSFKIDYWDSYDLNWGTYYGFGLMRLICLNGMQMPDFKLSFSAKHTSSALALDRVLADGTRAIGAFRENETRFRTWMHTPVTEANADYLFKHTLAAQKRDMRGKEHSEVILNELLYRFGREQPNLWGLYNAATNWSTHLDAQASDRQLRGARHNIERRRGGAISKMLKSPTWRSLEAA